MDSEAAERIYSAGECSVCGGAGAAVFLKALQTGTIFFGCPSCECAWSSPPQPHLVDTVDAPSRFAPRGFTYARMSDIKAAGMEPLVAREDAAESWDIWDDTGFSAT